jgi:uncharacterized protein (DUF924 family)/nitroreductase
MSRSNADQNHYPLHPDLEARWSPRAFAETSVDGHVLRGLAEAVRWSPSCFNEQPWRLIVAPKEDAEAFEKLASCLMPKNRAWAEKAPVLMLTVAASQFSRNGSANGWAAYDLGQAVGMLSVQATSLGLVLHQMGGFDAVRAREAFEIPAEYEVLSAVALGYPGTPESLDAEMATREGAPRIRRSMDGLVFGGRFGTPLETTADYHRVLEFWFGDFDADGLCDSEHRGGWYKKDPAFDADVQARFGTTHAAVTEGAHEHWTASPRGRLAAIITIDQFSRNMFRGSPDMYTWDAAALEYVKEGIELGHDRGLRPSERAFFYMPLMHSENVDGQQQCVDLFASLRDELTGPARDVIANNHKYAIHHYEIVEQFGRFPHRNEILGRESTAEETAFLKQPGSSF